MSDIKIPPLEYCNLERAAKILNDEYEIDDLIHLSEVGAIDLCVLLEDYDSVLYIDGFQKVEDSAKFFESNCRFRPDCFSFYEDSFEPTFVCYLMPHEHYQTNGAAYFEGIAYGLWSPEQSVITEIARNGYAMVADRLRPSNHREFMQQTNKSAMLFDRTAFYTGPLHSLDALRAEALTKEYGFNKTNSLATKISLRDLLISRKTLQLLEKHLATGEPIPNFVNGGVSRPKTEMKVHGNVEVSSLKREAVFKAAIYWLVNDRESCNGKRGELTIEAWADKIINERNNPKTRIELGIDKVKECLRLAKNGEV